MAKLTNIGHRCAREQQVVDAARGPGDGRSADQRDLPDVALNRADGRA
jgi:hypothetical protein